MVMYTCVCHGSSLQVRGSLWWQPLPESYLTQDFISFWCCPAIFVMLTGLQALHRKALGLQMLSLHVQILCGLWEF